MKLSVALCTYNGELFIQEQLDSILNQILPVNEIIVCDDGSTDKTMEILEEYKLKNPTIFKVYKNEINLRSVKNFEKAISLCTGDFIFLSDQDDIWAINKTKDYIDYFDLHPNINAIASNGYCIDEKSNVIEKYAIWDVPQFLNEKGIPFNYYKLICYVGNLATGASMAFRKELVHEIVPFPKIKDFHHDEWIAIISSRKNKFVLLNEKYFYYRIHIHQQVGGVFYDKTEKKKNELTVIYNIEEKLTSFNNYKKRLKKLCMAYHKNKKLIEIGGKYSSFFKENTVEIESLFYENKKLMIQLYPFLSMILNFTDKLTNKRQLIH